MEEQEITHEDKLEVLERYYENKDYHSIKKMLSDDNPVDIALLFNGVPREILPKIFRLLPKDIASDTFIEMDNDTQEHLISSFTDLELTNIVEDLFLDDTVDLIEEMPAHIIKRILSSCSSETRKSINTLLNYPKDSAGSIMTTEFVNLKSHMTVGEAFDRIRKTGLDKETIYTCYVTDESRKLIGMVSARMLMLSQLTDKIDDIMEENVIYANTSSDKEDVAKLIGKYGFLALPIVDNERRLVGIVTVDDAMDILREESTEDIIKMAAITPSDQPYLKTGFFKIYLSRMPWLLILMISATFTGFIIRSFEEVLNADVIGIILTACVPMLMDTAGNAGGQACVTVIRGISLNQIKFRDIFKVMLKECGVSILLGLTLAIACFGKLMLIDQLFRETNGLMIASVVCITMFLTVVIAKFVGCSLPLIAKKIRLDPAVVASPVITTIVDALAMMIYCSIAVAMLT